MKIWIKALLVILPYLSLPLLDKASPYTPAVGIPTLEQQHCTC